MATTCKRAGCNFDFGALLCEIEAKIILQQPEGIEGDKIRLFCPACAEENRVDLRPHGLFSLNGQLYRWSAAKTGLNIEVSPTMRVRLPESRITVINVQSICYESVPVFRLANGQLSYPRWPVRKEFLEVIDTRHAAEPELTRDGRYVMRIYFKGLTDPVLLDLPCVSVNPEREPVGDNAAFQGVHLVLWPNVEFIGWRRYFLRFGCTEEQAKLLYHRSREVRVFALAHRDYEAAHPAWVPVDAVAADGYTRYGCVESRPEWVAIEFGLKSGGVWDVKPATSPVYPPVETKIAVDFGTSNTCVAVGDTSRQEALTIESCDLPLILGTEELPTKINFADTWPPRKGFGKNRTLLPSELVTRKKLQEVRMQAENPARWRPVVDYGIPSSGNQVEFKEDEHIIAEFKWADRIQDTMLRAQAEELQKRYIEFVLLFALARLAQQNRLGAAVSVSFSYPLAFGKERIQKFTQMFEQVTMAVSQMTGLRVRHNPNPVDEARAAAGSIVPQNLACLYVDIGGGSSDIALDIKRLDPRGERLRYKNIASFQYAGGALVDAFDGGRCLSVSVHEFRRMVREQGVQELMDKHQGFSSSHERVFAKAFYFYGYLQEFLARLLAAHLVSGEWTAGLAPESQQAVMGEGYLVDLYPLGNGWGFGHLFDRDYARKVFAPNLTKRANQILDEAKQETGQELPRIELNVPPGFGRDDPKEAVVFGLLRGQPESRKPSGEDEDDWVFRTIVGCTTRVGPSRLIPWFRPITNQASRASVEGESELPNASLTCPPNQWPSFDSKLPTPHELDPGLNRTGNELQKCLRVGATWFTESPFHVLLEKLIGPKLKEIL